MDFDVRAEQISTLQPWSRNPNEGDVGAISESVNRNGWYGTIVAQKSSRRILAGHHRVIAAQQLGQDEVPVYWVDVDDATAERIVLADNRTSRLGRDDPAQLLDMLRDIAAEPLVGLAGTGWDGDDLDELLARLDGGIDPNKVWSGSGQPEYEHGDLQGAYRTTVHFRTEDDAEAFFEMLGKPKNRYLWWPEGDGHRGSDATEQWTADSA